MIQKKIEADVKEAMKSGNGEARSTLRMLLAAIRNKEIELEKKEQGLSDEEVMSVISSEVKRRVDAAEAFDRGARPELANKERGEHAILEAYLPPQLTDAELVQAARQVIQETGATSELDFARAMKALMPIVKGKASGDQAAGVLRAQLAKHA